MSTLTRRGEAGRCAYLDDVVARERERHEVALLERLDAARGGRARARALALAFAVQRALLLLHLAVRVRIVLGRSGRRAVRRLRLRPGRLAICLRFCDPGGRGRGPGGVGARFVVELPLVYPTFEEAEEIDLGPAAVPAAEVEA